MKLTEIGYLGKEIRDNPMHGDVINGWIVHIYQKHKLILRDAEKYTCRDQMTIKQWIDFVNKSGEFFKRGKNEERRKRIETGM
jgi:hypothetical protein